MTGRADTELWALEARVKRFHQTSGTDECFMMHYAVVTHTPDHESYMNIALSLI